MYQYGNTVSRVFKRGVQNWKSFLPKNQHAQKKTFYQVETVNEVG